jgi:hypothetical protein
VARNSRGQLVFAADDNVEARDDLARSLADTPSLLVAREILRKVQKALGDQ